MDDEGKKTMEAGVRASATRNRYEELLNDRTRYAEAATFAMESLSSLTHTSIHSTRLKNNKNLMERACSVSIDVEQLLESRIRGG
jgi:hypothetical protein